jgi:FkbM family methyltransferase
LDEESAMNVQNVISRLDLLRKSQYADIDIFSVSEEQELLATIKSVRNKELKLQDDLFYNYGCYLPKNHYELAVFIKQLNISLLPPDTRLGLEGKDFMDVGAFIGDSAFVLNKLGPRHIYAFEALSKNCELMDRSIELNQLGNVVIPVNCALGDTIGEVYIQDEGSGSSIQQEEGQSSEKVAMTTLDAFVEAHPEINVGLIKVDIEGAEGAFLKGAVNTIRKFRPVLLLSIYHNVNDFLNLKTEVEKLDLGYTFKISTPTFGAIVVETNLIAYVDDH